MPKRSSSVVGREFGNGVRAVIARTGLTHRRLAELLGWQEAKISDLTLGKGGVTEQDVLLLLGYCQATVEEREHLLALFHETRENGWLQIHALGAPLPKVLRTLLAHERLAKKVICWSLNLIPSLTQTVDYMRAVAIADTSVHDDVLENYIATRVERRAALDGREFVYYLHEHALRLPVGGRDVMADQLHHLLRVAVRPNMTLRIMPTDRGAHPGMAASFAMFEFPNAPTAVLPEGSLQSLWLDQPGSTAIYQAMIDALEEQTLPERDSLDFLTAIAAETAP